MLNYAFLKGKTTIIIITTKTVVLILILITMHLIFST